jgi:hypothetical protein
VLPLRGVAWQLIESGEKPADGKQEEWKPLMLKLGLDWVIIESGKRNHLLD